LSVYPGFFPVLKSPSLNRVQGVLILFLDGGIAASLRATQSGSGGECAHIDCIEDQLRSRSQRYSTNPLGDRSNFRGYRLETFGEDWAYDDSFEEFTAEKFDSKEWVDLFDDAGAKYFVITTKHHGQ
jgi:hypothetical protein